MKSGKRAMLLGSLVIAGILILWPVNKGVVVETAVIQRGELVQSIRLNGMVRYAYEQPLISLKSGVISHVYVQPGQEVQKGELLFKLNTAGEEQALAALQEMKYAQQSSLSGLNAAAAIWTVQNEWELQSYETQLLTSIETACIRASGAGMVDAVYAQEGDYAQEAQVLGMLRGSEKQIKASASAEQVLEIALGSAGYAQIHDSRIPVTLAEVSAADQNGIQTLAFETIPSFDEAGLKTGEYAEIELITNVQPLSALIPLSAIDAEGQIWMVENGCAKSSAIEPGTCSGTWMSADLEWEGKRVILYPDGYALKDGMAVQVKE